MGTEIVLWCKSDEEQQRGQKWDLDMEMIKDRGSITNQWKLAKKGGLFNK